MELLKTGVMTDDDVDAIRKLKESANVATKRGSINMDRVETFKTEQKHASTKSKFGYSRKRTNRISPTNPDV